MSSGELEPWEDAGLGLPENIWHHAAAFLHIHELLGRLVVLSPGHAAVLSDEACWSTLALPPGPTRLGHMLWLMLQEERKLWVPLLHQVRDLDLDMQSSTTRTVSFFRDLLLHGLSVDRALRSIRVRRIPVRPALEPGGEPAEQKFTKSDLTLVNPVPRSTVNDRRLFLLDPRELGSLRLNMVHFRYVRIRLSTQCLEPSVDFVAQHRPPCAEAEADRADVRADTPAEALILEEFGALEQLPIEDLSSGNPGGSFKSWVKALLPRYEVMFVSWD